MTVGVVVMAYGTPQSPDEIEAYYTDIRRGRAPSPEQLADLTRRYDAIGGVSPLAAITAAQAAAIGRALDDMEPGQYVVEPGLKHAAPKIEDGVAKVAATGAEQVVGLVLAPHYSAMSVGEYLRRAQAAATEHGLAFAGIESWARNAALVEFLTGEVRAGLSGLPDNTKVVFTAHSLPARIIDSGDPYPDELRATASDVAAAVGLTPWSQWSLAFQSAGRTPEPWIGPDILAVIDDLAGAEHADGVLVCPCGFVADHLEVLYDLDIEARARAEQRGLTFARTASINDDEQVMAALAALVRTTSTR